MRWFLGFQEKKNPQFQLCEIFMLRIGGMGLLPFDRSSWKNIFFYTYFKKRISFSLDQYHSLKFTQPLAIFTPFLQCF